MHYIRNYFIYSLLLFSLIESALFLCILVHELGHAIPALLFTEGRVSIYVGSLGDSGQTIKLRAGRLHFFIKYNSLKWERGFCSSGKIKPRHRRILMIAGGPFASIILTLFSVCLFIPMEWHAVVKWFLGVVALVSGQFSLASGIPQKKPVKIYGGKVIFNDAAQIANLVRKADGLGRDPIPIQSENM